MKRLIFLIAPLLFSLTACAHSTDGHTAVTSAPTASKSSAMTYAVPASCTQTSILATISPLIKGATVINSRWEPAAGTELADFLDNGGIACSYGNAQAEIGTTIKWVSDADLLFTKREVDWARVKYAKVVIPGKDVTAAYFLFKPVGPTQEFQIWALNILIGGTWIQINTSYLHDLEGATSLIDAAINSALIK